jgi:hypothetical protein
MKHTVNNLWEDMKQTKSHLFGTPDAKEIENKIGKHLI